jgi:hypothetical protein
MPEGLHAGKAAARGLGRSFAIGLALAVGTFFTAFAMGIVISPHLPGSHREVAGAIVVVVLVYWALVAVELVLGVVLRTALGRVASGNAVLIAALLSVAFLLTLGILTGTCR